MKGKDTHIRGMKLLGPVECAPPRFCFQFVTRARREFKSTDDPFPFTTLKFKMYEVIR